MNQKKQTHPKRSTAFAGLTAPGRPASGTDDLKSRFAAADSELPIDEGRRSETLSLLCREIQARANRPIQNKRLQLCNLLRYTDRCLPGIHILCCAVMLLLLLYAGNHDFTGENDAAVMVFLSMVFPCCLTLFSYFELRQLCLTGIAELGKTCFFHAGQLVGLTMAFSGILNLMAVSAGILFISLQWKIRLLQLGLYVLVPFIFMQCLCLGCMLTETGRRYPWLHAALGLPLALCLATLVQDRTIYTEAVLLAWAASLFAGILMLSVEVRVFFKKLEKGDILCTE